VPAVAILWLIGSFVGVIAFSLVMVIVLRPVHFALTVGIVTLPLGNYIP